MSVNSYLVERAANAVLSTDEKTSISTSVSTLQSRLNGYFTNAGDGLKEHFKFGSYTRGTILPRRMDAHSDIDYMVVFEKGGLKPQSYLDRLKTFVEKRYSTSEIYQSSPTIVLELNHIKFELVPALHAWSNTYQIPQGPDDWRYTSPNDFNQTLEDTNKNNSYLVKPTARLAKFWSAGAGYVFDSFSFEQWIVGRSYWGCTSQRDYLFKVIDDLSTNESTQWRKERIERSKKIVSNVRSYEAQQYFALAEDEVKKLIPA